MTQPGHFMQRSLVTISMALVLLIGSSNAAQLSTLTLSQPRPGMKIGNITLNSDFNEGYIVSEGPLKIVDVRYAQTGKFSSPWHILLGLQQIGTPEALYLANETDYAFREQNPTLMGFTRIDSQASDDVTMDDLHAALDDYVKNNKIDTTDIEAESNFLKNPPKPEKAKRRVIHLEGDPQTRDVPCASFTEDEKAACHGNHAASKQDCHDAIQQVPCKFLRFGNLGDQFVYASGACAAVQVVGNSDHDDGGFRSCSNSIWFDCIKHSTSDTSGVIDPSDNWKVCICNNANVGSC